VEDAYGGERKGPKWSAQGTLGSKFVGQKSIWDDWC